MADSASRKSRFLALRKRLKEERLFVKQEKEQLRKLNEKVLNLSQNLYYLEWKTRRHWINVDRLVSGKVNPSQCSATSRIIENVAFEDACSHLNYEDSKYGEFLLSIKENPKLIALILDYCDSKRLTTRHLTRLIISSLYGSCTQKIDENAVLRILQELMNLQILTCEDLLSFFCGKRATDHAFSCVLTLFSEMLFSSKLYLTAALHGTVMQVIVDDAIFLDVEVSKVLSRIPPKATMEKFGKPGTEASNNKIKEHMSKLHAHLVNLSKKFLKSLQDKIYCFPQSLRWAIGQLYSNMLTKMKLPEANAKAIIGYMIISHFICPAIINPEPYGINSDADISETARHNLSQIASILRSLAFLECGVKEDKFKVILEQFEPGIIMGYVTALLVGSENLNDADEISSNAMQCSVLITEHDLKTLIHCLQYLNACNIPSLNREGLGELLDTLPPPPRRWTKDTNIDRNIVSMPPGVDIDINAPVAPPRHMKLKKMKSSSTTDAGSLKELEKLKESLNTFIGEGQPVLIVPLRNESYQAVGMLSEEKVLGLNTNLATPNTFDIEATDEDKRRRASSLMLDALSEFFPKSGELIDFGDLDNISSGSDPFENSDNKTPRTINNQSNSPLITSQKNFQQNFEKTGLHNVPVDNLLNLGGEDNHNVPKLPEKKHKQKETDGVFYDEPLINLENDMFIGSQVKPTSPKRKRESNVSMLGGAGGINAILKSAAVPSPTSVKHNEFQDPWSPSNTSPAADPWAFSNDAKTTSESSEQMFESNFNPTNVRKSSPSSKIRHSIDPRYAEYSETVQRDKKLSTGKMIESDSNEDIGKLSRKKSHGAWLKDKISSKFSTGLQKAKTETLRKSDGHTVNKITSPPKSPIQPGTPMQASEVSKVKSASLISRGSSGEVDISEAILAKYRNMTTNDSSGTSLGDQHFGSPMSSQMEDIATQVQDEVVFDDEFKFDDAKRKLRSVLCTSGETPLPSDTHNFDHLLLTMLQALLAEAINLQNRFAVAQLHETLRSIKQLPGGSCEKLISKLEEDYENRSKYISYMIKCKQGLLSTISTFEQITTKLERDKTICRKYFTTLAVRLFLETEEHKREISHFGQRFVSTKLLDEKCTLLSEFLEQLHTAMLKDSTWSNCDDEEIEELMVATERAIMSKIYKEAFYPNGVFDVENDRIFHEHIKCLAQVITLSHPTLQIPKMYQKEAPWPSAQTELLMVNAYKTAADKLSCIHRCCITIMNLLSMATERPPGADDFVPVLVYVVLRANPPNLLSTKQYVNTFYETRLSGEQYYCWMQFCAAIEFIKTMRAPQK